MPPLRYPCARKEHPMTAKKCHVEVQASDHEVAITIDTRRYRIRGLEKNLSPHQLRVNVLAMRDDLVHMDTFDLCKAKSRTSFIKATASELYMDEVIIKQDVGHDFRCACKWLPLTILPGRLRLGWSMHPRFCVNCHQFLWPLFTSGLSGIVSIGKWTLLQLLRPKFADRIAFFSLETDAESAHDLCRECEVFNLPALVGFKTGERIETLIGLRPEDELTDILHRWAPD
jgi:hypothetical protein